MLGAHLLKEQVLMVRGLLSHQGTAGLLLRGGNTSSESGPSGLCCWAVAGPSLQRQGWAEFTALHVSLA